MSQCSAGDFANPDGARFCGHCGAAILQTISCPGCGAPNSPENEYCNACGHAFAESEPLAHGLRADRRARIPERVAAQIRASRTQLEDERKQVSVLFADVVGSTKLAERTGAERWQQLIELIGKRSTEHRHRAIAREPVNDPLVAVNGFGDDREAGSGRLARAWWLGVGANRSRADRRT